MRRLFQGLLILALVALAAILGAGQLLSRPARHDLGGAPADIGAEPVSIPLQSGGRVAGWLVKGRQGAGAVLLLHGIRGDRRDMLPRARFLRAAGYSVLLVDLPAHGESSGERITFGIREGEGAAAALSFLRRELAGERVGVIAVSLGAAALVLARPHPAPDAVVLESLYPSLAEAVSNRLRLRLGSEAGWLAPLLLWQMPWRLGVTADELRPIHALADLGSPLLLMAGDRDRHTPPMETKRLFAAAAAPKDLWMVSGAAHEDLHRHDPAAYEPRVKAFLASHLRQ